MKIVHNVGLDGTRRIQYNYHLPRSPNQTPLDFMLWNYVKQRLYIKSAYIIEVLRKNITNSINELQNNLEPLQRIMFSLRKRKNLHIRQNGHFEHLQAYRQNTLSQMIKNPSFNVFFLYKIMLLWT
ncbi:unnamed protein product [Psylliodes chrysocephalus]|uniref:Uncharacterized protein n=1 Tax=Psylliodes chrysocephalus TaxID=3402493 RepID=A0A9P0GCT2_9CUCU|nr:unnamed protein product [Psylliodes chrysocephala]